jgi:tRNA pseudouridine38-40 synthase
VRTFKLVVAFDGTDFHGWQRQPGERTVQGVLETALADALGVPVTLRGAGRTDAGVHARGQVASLEVDTTLPAAALRPALAARLPRDVRVLAAEEAGAGFDARRSATARRYSYRLLRREDPMLERFAWRPRTWPEGGALEAATRTLEGRHDCSSFRSAGSSETRPVCAVSRAGWREWEGGLALDITADHFLYHMVRTIVGTALRAAATADPAAAMRTVRDAGDRAAAGPTAPAHGLCLEEVLYEGARS